MVANLSLLNDNVERQIKVVKDRIRTVHSEDFLQNVIITGWSEKTVCWLQAIKLQ